MSAPRSLIARPVRLLCAALAVVWLLAACAPGGELVRSGKELIEQGKTEEGLSQIDKALALDPGNTEYRLLAMRQREVQLNKLIRQGDAARDAQQFDEAQAAYQRAQGFDTANNRARSGLEDITQLRRQQQRLDEAEAALTQGRRDEAEQKLRQVLAESPGHARALALRRQLDEQPGGKSEPAEPVL